METPSLKGQLLIAMPGMPDPRFAGTVSLVCYHNNEGAMALVLNRLVGTLRVDQVLDSLKSDIQLNLRELRVHLGGPVATGRGFVLHGDELKHHDSQDVTDDVALNATTEVLHKLIMMENIADAVPYRFALGCASWTAGQLEDELRRGAWITAPATRDLVFMPELAKMWQQSMMHAGINHPELLVAETGTA